MTQAVCRHCGKDIQRVFVGPTQSWGHTTNPGPNHHYAVPLEATIRPVVDFTPGAANPVAVRTGTTTGQRAAS